MLANIGIRLFQSITVLLLMTAVVFLLGRLGGDPISTLVPKGATTEEIMYLEAKFGLDKSLPEQYWVWLKLLAHGDLGKSLLHLHPVAQLLKDAVPNTLKLAAFSMLFASLLGIPLGCLSGVWRGRWLDAIAKITAVFGQSIPVFWLGLVLMYFFAIKLHIFPIMGSTGLRGAVLPSVSLGFFMTAGVARLTRSAMIEAMESDYVTLARIKGLSETVVIFRHALRNALIPVVTYTGMYFAILMSGVVVVEVIFAWPGIGLMTFKSALGGDYPVLQGAVMLITAIVIVANLIVDIAYTYLDPRIRKQKV